MARSFRFEDLQIWQRSAELNLVLFGIADDLERRKKFRFAEQLRAAALSITNNIAEGSGSTSNGEFRNFLNYARRSIFECANILLLLMRHKTIDEPISRPQLQELEEISRMITAFSKTLRS